MSRSDNERLRDILDCIEGIDRAEAIVRRYPDDPETVGHLQNIAIAL